jgi:hypothetical protein
MRCGCTQRGLLYISCRCSLCLTWRRVGAQPVCVCIARRRHPAAQQKSCTSTKKKMGARPAPLTAWDWGLGLLLLSAVFVCAVAANCRRVHIFASPRLARVPRILLAWLHGQVCCVWLLEAREVEDSLCWQGGVFFVLSCQRMALSRQVVHTTISWCAHPCSVALTACEAVERRGAQRTHACPPFLLHF